MIRKLSRRPYLSLTSALLLTTALTLLGDVPRRSTTSDLGGAERFLTYVSTDKPIYRPGETVYV